LSFVEDAAYSRLIRKYYAQEKALPADLKAVQRLVGARSKEEREAVETVLAEFFELREDGYHNTRCDEEISRYQDKQAKAKASADARWNKQRLQSDGNANASPDAMRTHSEGNAHQTPDTRHHKKHSSVPDAPDPGFAQFWETWPKTDRKTAKAECAKRWKARGLEGMAATIIADVASRKQTRQWQEGFEPAPLTYLNQRRWEDSGVGEHDPFR